MITIDLQSRVPIYLQLENRISELVLLGELEKDQQLPSVRSLAKELGINPNTIQKAYQELEAKGVIYSVGGRGNFIATPENLSTAKRAESLLSLQKALQSARTAGVTVTEAHVAVDTVYGKGGERV